MLLPLNFISKVEHETTEAGATSWQRAGTGLLRMSRLSRCVAQPQEFVLPCALFPAAQDHRTHRFDSWYPEKHAYASFVFSGVQILPGIESFKKDFGKDASLTDGDPRKLEMRAMLEDPIGQKYIGQFAKKVMTQVRNHVVSTSHSW